MEWKNEHFFEKGEKFHGLTKGFYAEKGEVTVRSSEFLGAISSAFRTRRRGG